jgi:hypothetical protein
MGGVNEFLFKPCQGSHPLQVLSARDVPRDKAEGKQLCGAEVCGCFVHFCVPLPRRASGIGEMSSEDMVSDIKSKQMTSQ